MSLLHTYIKTQQWRRGWKLWNNNTTD